MALEHDEVHRMVEEAAVSISSPRRRYVPVGRCIYCGVPAEEAGPRGLGDEHIIPLSLGGTLELPEASCDRCTDETHTFEGFCAGNTLKAARTLLHWKSRKSKRPKTLKIGLSMENWIDLNIAEYPPIVMLPTFGPPGILINTPKEYGVMTPVGCSTYLAPEFKDRWDRLGPDAAASVPFTIDTLCRMFAKIAHSYSVAELGLDGFEHFLPEMILGKCMYFSHYVGNAIVHEAPTPELHTLTIDTIGNLMVVYVRLYARYGLATYMVVVGRMKP